MAPINGPVPGDYCISERTPVFDAKTGRLVARQDIELLEASLVEEQLDSLSRGQFPQIVLSFDGSLIGGVQGVGAQPA